MLEKEKKMVFHTMFGIRKDYKAMNIGKLKMENFLECLNYQTTSRLLIHLNKDHKKLNLVEDANLLKNVGGLLFVLLFDTYIIIYHNIYNSSH